SMTGGHLDKAPGSCSFEIAHFTLCLRPDTLSPTLRRFICLQPSSGDCFPPRLRVSAVDFFFALYWPLPWLRLRIPSRSMANPGTSVSGPAAASVSQGGTKHTP